MSAKMHGTELSGVKAVSKRKQDDRTESQAQKIQAECQRAALLRGRTEAQRTELYRAGSRVRTNEIQYELQTFPPFW